MPSVLLADDDPVSLRYLRDAFTLLGAHCTTATDGPAALGLARAQRFDAIVLDLRLPGLDGVAVLAQLRSDANAASRAVIAWVQSGDLDEATRRRVLAAGFAGAWQKPVPMDALARVLAASPAHALDDAAGLAAAGSSEILSGLRRLFRDELPRSIAALAGACAARDAATASEIVHKLKGGCRFCGATHLLAALEQLELALDRVASCDTQLAAVEESAQSTLPLL